MKQARSLLFILLLSIPTLNAFAQCQAELAVLGQLGESNDTIFICSNMTLQFEDESLLEGLISLRTWDFGDGSNVVDGLQIPLTQYAYTTPGTYIMKLTVASILCTQMVAKRVIVVLGQPSYNLSALDATCAGNCDGQTTVSVSGPNAGFYNFIWSDANAQETATAVDLCPDDYYVMISDDFGCSDVTTNTITVGEPSVFSASVNTITMPDCEGDATGSVSISTSGGSGPYTFDIGNGEQASNFFSGLSAGDYVIVAKNSSGCEATVPFTIGEPSAIEGSIDELTHVVCTGTLTGSVTITASGGTFPYTYDLGSGPQSSGFFAGLPAANYSVIVKDDHGCQTTVGFTINEPSLLSASVDSYSDVDCNGNATGSVVLVGTGGTAPYSYDIGLGSQPSGNFVGLTAGDYFLTITDANACQNVIGFTVNEPLILSASVDASSDADCNGNLTGSASVSASGGTSPYTFDIGNGPQADGNFSGLSAGSYTVTIVDDHGCTTTVPVVIGEPSALSASLDASSDADCNGNSTGSASVSASGGTSPYMFDIGSGPQNDGNFSGLSAGSYTVSVTDDHGCTIMVPVVIGEPDILAVNFSSGANISLCPSNGSTQLDVVISGGTGPFTSDWTASPDLNVINVTSAVLTPTESSVEAQYVVTVTDFNGCNASDMITVSSTSSSLQGTLTMGNLPCIECWAFMYEYDAVNPGVWSPIDSVMTDVVGYYDFGQVDNFQAFVLMANPNDAFYPMSVETYYPAEYDWNNAAVFNMCGNDFVKDIAMIEPMLFNGSNTLSGTLWYDPSGKTETEEDPIPLIDVVVEKTPPGQAQGRVSTNTNGEYEFSFVPSSDTTYTIFVNIPGVPVTNTYEILANSAGQVFDHLDFCVNIDWTEIQTCQVGEGLSSEQEESNDLGFMLYPNPSNGMFAINTGKFAETDAEIRIMDTSGRLVFIKQYEQIPYVVNMVNMAEGYYIVQIMNGNASDSSPISVMRY
ncbi:MAG: T9SS type A sorting domain-containing protein [Flavobacteriales bacterium]|nr:T9SS type A sorting domain-containing protein [Flavobacteriales bacterium]